MARRSRAAKEEAARSKEEAAFNAINNGFAHEPIPTCLLTRNQNVIVKYPRHDRIYFATITNINSKSCTYEVSFFGDSLQGINNNVDHVTRDHILCALPSGSRLEDFASTPLDYNPWIYPNNIVPYEIPPKESGTNDDGVVHEMKVIRILTNDLALVFWSGYGILDIQLASIETTEDTSVTEESYNNETDEHIECSQSLTSDEDDEVIKFYKNNHSCIEGMKESDVKYIKDKNNFLDLSFDRDNNVIITTPNYEWGILKYLASVMGAHEESKNGEQAHITSHDIEDKWRIGKKMELIIMSGGRDNDNDNDNFHSHLDNVTKMIQGVFAKDESDTIKEELRTKLKNPNQFIFIITKEAGRRQKEPVAAVVMRVPQRDEKRSNIYLGVDNKGKITNSEYGPTWIDYLVSSVSGVGLGKYLVDLVCANHVFRGYPYPLIGLGVNRNNARAIKFYERVGLHPLDWMLLPKYLRDEYNENVIKETIIMMLRGYTTKNGGNTTTIGASVAGQNNPTNEAGSRKGNSGVRSNTADKIGGGKHKNAQTNTSTQPVKGKGKSRGRRSSAGHHGSSRRRSGASSSSRGAASHGITARKRRAYGSVEPTSRRKSRGVSSSSRRDVGRAAEHYDNEEDDDNEDVDFGGDGNDVDFGHDDNDNVPVDQDEAAANEDDVEMEDAAADETTNDKEDNEAQPEEEEAAAPSRSSSRARPGRLAGRLSVAAARAKEIEEKKAADVAAKKLAEDAKLDAVSKKATAVDKGSSGSGTGADAITVDTTSTSFQPTSSAKGNDVNTNNVSMKISLSSERVKQAIYKYQPKATLVRTNNGNINTKIMVLYGSFDIEVRPGEQCTDQKRQLSIGETIDIPKGAKYKVKNVSNVEGCISETVWDSV